MTRGRSGLVRISGAVLATAAVAALTAGCSGDGGSDGPGPSSKKAVDLVLTDSDLPGGYQARKLTKDGVQQMLDQMSSSTKDVEVDPAKCKTEGSVPEKADLKSMGLMVATNSSLAISASVRVATDLPDGAGVDAAKRVAADPDCASVTVRMGAGPAKGADVRVTTTVLDVPVPGAEQSLVVKKATHTENGAKKGDRTVLVGRADVKGYAITVEMSPVADGHDVNEPVFREVFSRAVAKVAADAGD